MKRFKFFLSLSPGNGSRFAVLEEARSHFNKPFRVDCTNFSHVFF
jgi:hypothetical protein